MTKQDADRVLIVRGYTTQDCALVNFQKDNKLDPDGILGPKSRAALLSIKKRGMNTSAQVFKLLGPPDAPNAARHFTRIVLPYPQRLAWAPKIYTKGFDCHKQVAAALVAIYGEILAVYGIDEIKRLGIDLYGGCYALRNMRGGTSWSKHAWAVAVDQHPAANPLHEKADKADFALPAYAAMLQIFYKHGFVNQGIELGFDYMHFEPAPGFLTLEPRI